MSGTNYSDNTEINVLNKILGKFPKSQLATFDYPLTVINNSLTALYDEINAGINVTIENFPSLQDVLVKNTTLSVDVSNFPSVQDTAPQNTTITPTEDTLSTTATTAVQLTATSTLVNVLILSNVSTTDTIYIGFSSGSQPHAISPNGKFIYDNEIRQINLNTIYIKGSGGIDIGYTYFN